MVRPAPLAQGSRNVTRSVTTGYSLVRGVPERGLPRDACPPSDRDPCCGNTGRAAVNRTRFTPRTDGFEAGERSGSCAEGSTCEPHGVGVPQ